ncbi:hypothetical protein BCC0238_007065 (plasmid) [Burkholderia gladioli]
MTFALRVVVWPHAPMANAARTNAADNTSVMGFMVTLRFGDDNLAHER